MKKKIMTALVVCCVLLSGCQSEEVSSPEIQENTVASTYENEALNQEKEAHQFFEFTLPEGCEIQIQSEKTCDIIYEGQNVGGFVITDLCVEDIKGSESIAFAQYLNKTHEGCEYSSWLGDDDTNPAKYVNQYVEIPESSEDKEFYRVLFERDSRIYDMWFDCDMIDQANIEVFVATIVEQ